MKKFYVLFSFFLFLQISLTGQEFNHQIFTCKDIRTLNILVNTDNIDVVEIKGSRLLIDTYININEVSPKFIRLLVKRGTYNLHATYNNVLGELTLSTPPRKKMIVRGNVVKEDLKYIIYVPEDINISIKLLQSKTQ